MNILISGASGFIGENLCRFLLDKAYNIHCILRQNSNSEYLPSSIHIYRFDGDITLLSQYLSENNISLVIHLASLVIAEHKQDQVKPLIESNILFGTQLLEAMQIAGVKNFINTGTMWQHIQSESTEYHPSSLYAATKEAFEKIIDFYVEKEDFSALTLTLFDSYGINDRRGKLISLLGKFSEDKITLDMTPGEQEINLVYIDDICKAYLTAIKMFEENRVKEHLRFAVSSDEIVTLKQLIEVFEATTSKKLSIIWGAKTYRKSEVMKCWKKYQRLPGWQAEISLKKGLSELFNVK
jgi:nucleoside-diphosphate-sugar epimerase